MASLKDVNDFLARKQILVVGVSRNPKDFTRVLFRELRQRGYDAVPVNPAVTEMEGVRCFARVSEAPPAEAALLLTKPQVTALIALECVNAGVQTVWMYRAAGSGAVHRAAADLCRSSGIRVIEGECPFMFLPKAGFPHTIHGFIRKVCGSYPR